MAMGGIHCLDGADASTARTKRADNQIAGLASKGCTVWNMALANMHSLPQETTDRKAGCGKSARPVWREGWSSNLHPYPYFIVLQGPKYFCFRRRGAQISGIVEWWCVYLNLRTLRAPRRRKTKGRRWWPISINRAPPAGGLQRQ